MSEVVPPSDSRTPVVPCTTSSSEGRAGWDVAAGATLRATDSSPFGSAVRRGGSDRRPTARGAGARGTWPDRRSRWTARLPAVRRSGPPVEGFPSARATFSFIAASPPARALSSRAGATLEPISEPIPANGAEVGPELRGGRELALLSALAGQRPDQVIHGDLALLVDREERGGQHHVADLTAGELEAASEEPEVDVVTPGGGGWDQQPPQPFASVLVGLRELDVEV